MGRKRYGKDIYSKSKIFFRKWMSAKIIPYMVLNGWRIFACHGKKSTSYSGNNQRRGVRRNACYNPVEKKQVQ